ncbi:MAG: sigma-70 family RNA polymerase sigma factor [Gemmatimonas sp.]
MQDIDRLFREFHAPIVRYLTRQLNDADLAEELAQETFVRALRYGRAENKPVTNERAWLFAVATNLIRDTVRRDTRQRKHLMALAAELGETEPEAVEPTPEELRQAATAQQALQTIPERDRAALFMSQEGLNYQEIAAALGLSVQSVGTTLTRARKKVVQRYEDLSRLRDGGGAHVAS